MSLRIKIIFFKQFSFLSNIFDFFFMDTNEVQIFLFLLLKHNDGNIMKLLIGRNW